MRIFRLQRYDPMRNLSVKELYLKNKSNPKNDDL